MGALVLEGGTFRPIFSSGVMDALNDHGVDSVSYTHLFCGNH